MTVTLPVSTRPLQLNRYFTEVPQKIADQEGLKAKLYSLASKVCLVALVAIMACFLSIQIGLLVPIQTSILVTLLFSTIPLNVGMYSFHSKAIICHERATQSAEQAKELSRIQHWKEGDIEAFFKEHKLDIRNLPLSLLRKQNPEAPLGALLPGIASYQYFSNKAKKCLEESIENLHNMAKDPIVHFEERRLGWQILEFDAIPAALQAALVLQVIANPTLQVTMVDELGAFRAKAFDRRRFDQMLDGEDEYFVFNEKSRLPLTFTEAKNMVSIQDLDGLRNKLFAQVSK